MGLGTGVTVEVQFGTENKGCKLELGKCLEVPENGKDRDLREKTVGEW